MIRYIVIIVTFIFIFIFAKLNKKYQNKIEYIGLVLLSILSGLRYSTGTDYFSYLELFNKIKENIDIIKIEKGYLYLNKIVGKLGLNYNWVLFFCSLGYLIMIYMKLKEVDRRYRWISISLFLLNFNLFFFSLSIVRQSLAIGIFLLSSKFIAEKNKIQYFINLVIGSLFHSSILLLLPFYFINKVKKRDIFKKVLPLSIVLTIILEKIIKNVFILELGNRIFPNFSYYIIRFEKTPVSLAILIKSVILLIICYYIKIYFITEKEDVIYKIYLFSIVIRILMALGFGSIFYRLISYFEIFEILIIPILFDKINGKNLFKRIIIILVLFYNTFYFIRTYNVWNNMVGYKETNETFKILLEKNK